VAALLPSTVWAEEAIVMSVGLSAALQQQEERQEATQWRLGY
jgi:hypothetical protein